MTAKEWDRVETLFGEAMGLPLEQREAHLREACGGDTHIFQEVMTLLAELEEADGFFDALGDSLQDGWQEASPLSPGDRLGPYQVETEIGRGGMAVVYRATRADGAYEEQVAIKILKKGLDTAAILQRFRYEQQLLVDLRHPGIATLLDGGETPSGQPFLVMEYIDGQALDQYLASQELSEGQRLQLFQEIIAAVQHAHQRLVVHRDLKPSNILVDQQGHIKLLDFGIAKLLDEESSGQPITQAEQRLLTPRYAAPEQRSGGPISTATDVFQLGLLLAEMLGVERQEGEPLPLRQLPKDLAAIIGLACREDPQRRYASAGDLGRDISHYLNHRPIQARPESWAYLTRKFIQRNRLGVVAASLILLTLIGGILATTWQARKAEQAYAQELEQRERAEAVKDFLVYLFARIDPYRYADSLSVKDLTVKQFVDLSLEHIRQQEDQDPALKLEVLDLLSGFYYNISERQRSYELDQEILALTKEELGTDHPKYASRLQGLAGSAMDLGYWTEADSLFQLALPANKIAYGYQPRHLAVVYNDYGILKSYQGDFEAADTLYQEALRIMRLNQIYDTANYAQTLGNQSDARRYVGDFAGAYRNCREAIRLLRLANYEGSVFMAHSYHWMGKALLKMDSLPQAMDYAQRARSGFAHHLGKVSHFHALTYGLEAQVYRSQERYESQFAYFDSAKIIMAQLYGSDNYNSLQFQLYQAEALIEMEQYNRATDSLQRALRFFEAQGLTDAIDKTNSMLDKIRTKQEEAI